MRDLVQKEAGDFGGGAADDAKDRISRQLPHGEPQLLVAATAAYTQAVVLLPIAPSWLDLAMSYSGRVRCASHSAGVVGGRGDVAALKRAALAAAKKAVSLDVGSATAWTSLGAIAAQCDEPALSQHACIKALALGPANAVPWINLGALCVV